MLHIRFYSSVYFYLIQQVEATEIQRGINSRQVGGVDGPAQVGLCWATAPVAYCLLCTVYVEYGAGIPSGYSATANGCCVQTLTFT